MLVSVTGRAGGWIKSRELGERSWFRWRASRRQNYPLDRACYFPAQTWHNSTTTRTAASISSSWMLTRPLSPRLRRAEVAGEQTVDQFYDPATGTVAHHQRGPLLQLRHRVRHRRAQPAKLQQRHVVLAVADPDH